MNVFVVTKNVRSGRAIIAGADLREGMAITGAKALSNL
jgi:hypothetical protein